MMELPVFFSRLLELSPPWTIESVAWDERGDRVNVYLECAQTTHFPCPECGRRSPVCDYSPLRTWKHLDTCGRTTHLHAGLPIVDCEEHGRQQPRPPWGDPNSPVTFALERLVARLGRELRDTGKTARFVGVERIHVRHILRSTPEAEEETGTETAGGGAEVDGKIMPRTPPGPQARQLDLFGQNDMVFVNQGIRAYRNLELEKAVELFHEHRRAHPGGYDVSSRLAAAEILLDGLRKAPGAPRERTRYLCGFWDSFEDCMASGAPGPPFLADEVKRAFFSRAIEEIERGRGAGAHDTPPAGDGSARPGDSRSAAEHSALPDGELPSTADDSSTLPDKPSPPAAETSPALAGDIPLGYLYLQAGRYDEAIHSLQRSIPRMRLNAALYGYLGDAYGLRGDWKTARQCYRDACLIDPAGIDWRHLQDEDLKELKRELSFDYGSDPDLALAWVPSHARIDGLFERKVVRMHEGLKEMVEVYLALEKAWTKRKAPLVAPRLFFRGMILCENEEHLKFIRQIDLIQVRRRMKEANPDLFRDFMETIVEGKG